MNDQPNKPSQPIPVAVLGATGAVGQRFIQLLEHHPWFRVVALTGSDRSVGHKYGETCHWVIPETMPASVRDLVVQPTDPARIDVPLVFSALPTRIAIEAEPAFAKKGVYVCSNASAFRDEPDVPLLLPEVNPQHTGLIHPQRRRQGWSGFIVTNPNCTITGLTIALKPLLLEFGVDKAFVVSMQAVSGAGYPGVPSLDILGNVLPYVGGEEEKMEWEPRKMLGEFVDGAIELADFRLSAHANRVPVSEGHTICLSVAFTQKASIDEIARVLGEYLPPEVSRHLPSAPKSVIQVRTEPDRPQPRLDVMAGGGMTTVIGRIRPDPILDVKMVILSHNTIRGAAGGSIYNAELLLQQDLMTV